MNLQVSGLKCDVCDYKDTLAEAESSLEPVPTEDLPLYVNLETTDLFEELLLEA